MYDYDYYEAVEDDVREFIDDNVNLEDFDSKEELEQYLNDELWCEDSVTGNASGSYTFNRYKAEEYLCHNYDLLREAMEEFCMENIPTGAEEADVTIRCYLLGSCIASVLEKLDYDFDKNDDDLEDIEQENNF